MRQALRRVINGTLGQLGYEVRRKHESEQFLRGRDLGTIVDGGANVGNYTAKMRAMFPSADIHLFEPTPALQNGLRERFASDPKVHCYGQALGSEVGTAMFSVAADSVSSSLLEEGKAGGHSVASVVSVPVTTLNEWARDREFRRPIHVKLDLEGNELNALRGANDFLKQVDSLELEVAFVEVRRGQPTLRQILDFTEDNGFSLIDVYPGVADGKTGLSTWADGLFSRRSSVSAGS